MAANAFIFPMSHAQPQKFQSPQNEFRGDWMATQMLEQPRLKNNPNEFLTVRSVCAPDLVERVKLKRVTWPLVFPVSG